MVDQKAGKQGRCDLGCHGKGIVKSGVFSDVSAACHFHHHREGIDVDGRPADADQSKQKINDRGRARQGDRNGVAGSHQRDSQQNRLFSSQLIRDPAEGHKGGNGTDGRREQIPGTGPQICVEHLDAVARKGGGDGVVCHKPQKDGKQDQDQACKNVFWKFFAFVFLDLRFGLRVHQRFHFLQKSVFFDGENQNQNGQKHERGNDCKNGQEGLTRGINGFTGFVFLAFEKKHHHNGGKNTADVTHEIDDRVGFGAKRFRGHVRHIGNRRRAVSTHHKQKGKEHDHKPDGVFRGSEHAHKNEKGGGKERADENVGRSFSQTSAGSVGKRAEQRKHENGKDVIDRHDGVCLQRGKRENVFQNVGNDLIVHLPECKNGHEGKTDERGAFDVEFHRTS